MVRNACIATFAPLLTVTDWNEEDTEAAGGNNTTQHLWEESWDDDDTNDDFSAQLKWVSPDLAQ